MARRNPLEREQGGWGENRKLSLVFSQRSAEQCLSKPDKLFLHVHTCFMGSAEEAANILSTIPPKENTAAENR